jgi:hypothetical protein
VLRASSIASLFVSQRPLALTALSLSVCTVGCVHEDRVKVPPAAVPAIVEGYGASATVYVYDEGRRFSVTPERSPDLEISGRCRIWNLFDCLRLHAPLDRVRFDGQVLRVRWGGDEGEGAVKLDDVRDASLLLHGYEQPPGWRPRWGWGLAIAGASGLAAAMGEWRPVRWLGLEGGLLLFHGPFGGYAAMRLRPVESHGLAPFTGWFVNAITSPAASGKPSDMGGVGPRLGLEIALSGGHSVVTVEGDLVHPLGDTEQYFGQHGRWVPWGGGSFAEFF